MKYLFILVLSLALVSCASKKDRKRVPPEVKSIKNSDFTLAKEIQYSKKTDKITLSTDDMKKSNILKLESLDRSNLFEDFEVGSSLDKLAKTCYEKEFEDAKNKIRKLEESYRSNIIFWNQVATCFMLQKKYRKALLFYNKALEFDPSYAPVLNNIGVMYETRGEDEKALLSYKKAISSDKYARTPKLNAALLYLKYGLYPSAKSILIGLKNLDQNDQEVLNAYATTLLMQGDIDSSLSTYNSMDKDLFEKASYGINYSMSLYLSNKRKDAVDVFEDIDIDRKSDFYDYYSKVKSTLGVR